MKDELTEIKEKIRKYIIKKINEHQVAPYFKFNEISSELGLDVNIVQKTVKSFEEEKHIEISYEYPNKPWCLFRIVGIDEKWLEGK